jgi:hypothetical protein
MESWILSEGIHPLAFDSAMTAADVSKITEDEVSGILASAAFRISERGQKLKDLMHRVLIESGRQEEDLSMEWKATTPTD